MATMKFSSILYEVTDNGKVANITLNRPAALNAIDQHMPREIREAVRAANADPSVHCIVVKGRGKGFCGGYDLKIWAEHAQRGITEGSQDVAAGGYDPFVDYHGMKENTECFMELFHSHKPTIAKVHGAAVAGGSDIALCCDMIVMADDARIGYPPARVWGSPTTAMWAFRLGAEKAKRMLFTGDLIDGKEAERIGLVLKAVPASELDATVQLLVDRIKSVPINQLWMQKSVINASVTDRMLALQERATVYDGLTRNSPEGVAFQTLAARRGFKDAISQRDEPGRSEQYRKVWKSVL